MQQREQMVIVNTGAGNFFSDLPKRNSPLAQQHPLIVAHVFIHSGFRIPRSAFGTGFHEHFHDLSMRRGF